MITLTSLGTAEFHIDDSALTPLAGHTFAALLYLCAERGRPVPRTILRSMLFPRQPVARRSHSLRQLLYRVRQAGVPLVATPDTVTLAAADVRDDIRQIEARGAATAAELAAIQRGHLPGYEPQISAAYAKWLDQHREDVSIRLRRVLVEQLSVERTRYAWETMVAVARACLSLDPLNEAAALGMSEALAMIGSKSEAMHMLETYNGGLAPGSAELRLSPAMLARRISEPHALYMPRSKGEVELVGRQQEMDQLVAALAEIEGKRPRIIRVSGEAGIGKSRLVEEFIKLSAFRPQPVRFVTVRMHPSDGRRPLAAFYDIVPRLLAVRGSLGCSSESMALLQRFGLLRGALSPVIGEEERDSELLFARITAAIQDLLAALAAERTLLLVIEDAQWMDGSSMQLLEEALRWQDEAPLGVLLTTRTDDAPLRWKAARDEVLINLAPLDAASCARFIDLLIGDPDRASAAFRGWVARTSGGLPLYGQLLVQHYESTGQEFEVPISVRSLIAIRLNELPPMALKVIEGVAVLGRYATIERVQPLLGITRYDLLIALQDLEDRRLLRHDGEDVRTAYALLEDSVESRMQPLVARVLHREVAALLESEMSPDSGHVPWDCARHWQRGGAPDRAIAALRRCARQALAVGQSADACEVLARLGKDPEADPRLKRAILEELVDIAEATAEWRFAPDAISQLLEDSASDAHNFRRVEFTVLRLEALYRTSLDLTTGNAALREILLSRSLGASIRLRAATLVVERADETNDLTDLELARQVAAEIEASDDLTGLELRSLYFQLVYHASFGDLDHVVSLASRLAVQAQSAASPTAHVRFLANAGVAFFRAGLGNEAEDALLKAAQIAGENRLPTLQLAQLGRLAHFAIACDQRAKAEDYLRLADAVRSKCQSASLTGSYCWVRAVLLILDADYVAADRWISDCEALLPGLKVGKKKLSAQALRLLIKTGRGDPISLDEVEGVVGQYEAAKVSSLDDMVMLGIATALSYCGERARAKSLVQDYLRVWRRDRMPAPAALKALAVRSANPSGQRPA